MPNWIPDDLDALQAALNDGKLDEDHHNDFKRELATETKSAKRRTNRNLAGDLAAMAVDGGRIWIGVDGHDNDESDPEVAALNLVGLAERVESVARSIPTPPLSVRSEQIGDSESGVLVVEVPWSPDAPHMVEDRYRGRGDRQNRNLSDIEVREILKNRSRRPELSDKILDDALGNDPVADQELARLHIVATPSVPRSPTMLIEHVDDFRDFMIRSIQAEPPGRPARLQELWNSWVGMLSPARRTGSYAMTRFPLDSSGRAVLPKGQADNHLYQPHACTDLEIREDGTVRFFNAAMADEGHQGIAMDRLLGFTWHVLRTAGFVAKTCRYVGPWEVSLALVGGKHLKHSRSPDTFLAHPDDPDIGSDPFRRRCRLSAPQLRDVSAGINELCGPLCRAFRVSMDVPKSFADPR